MPDDLGLLKSLGVPSGVAGFVIAAAVWGDKALKRYAEHRKAQGEDSRAERQLLASDQAAFRKSLLEQVDSLQDQLREAEEATAAAVSRHLDAERRVVEFQLTIARLAAALISSGIGLPPGASADLGLTPPPREAGKPA